MPVLVDMEERGIKVDQTELSSAFRTTSPSAWPIWRPRRTSSPVDEFNVGSPKQLGEVLFDEMSIEGGKKTKTGAYQTGADVLERSLPPRAMTLPARMLDWRQMQKLKSNLCRRAALPRSTPTPDGCTPLTA